MRLEQPKKNQKTYMQKSWLINMASDKKDCTSMEEVQVLKYVIKFVLGNKGMKNVKIEKKGVV